MEVICEDLRALTTARAREFWICWSRLFFKLIVWKVVIERVTVVEIRMDSGGGNGQWTMEVVFRSRDMGGYSEDHECDSSRI